MRDPSKPNPMTNLLLMLKYWCIFCIEDFCDKHRFKFDNRHVLIHILSVTSNQIFVYRNVSCLVCATWINRNFLDFSYLCFLVNGRHTLWQLWMEDIHCGNFHAIISKFMGYKILLTSHPRSLDKWYIRC